MHICISLHRGWRCSAPFCERLRNRRVVAFGMTHEAICPAVSDGGMAVTRQDAIPPLTIFPSKSSTRPRLWAGGGTGRTRRGRGGTCVMGYRTMGNAQFAAQPSQCRTPSSAPSQTLTRVERVSTLHASTQSQPAAVVKAESLFFFGTTVGHAEDDTQTCETFSGRQWQWCVFRWYISMCTVLWCATGQVWLWSRVPHV